MTLQPGGPMLRFATAFVLTAGVSLQAFAQCRPGDLLIGEDSKHYYCATKTCAGLEAQLAQDRTALERLEKNILETNAEMKEWTAANRQAAQDALKVAVNALHDAALGKMQVLAEGRLRQVERNFARRAPQGERWQRLLEKARSLESQSARLHGTIDSLKLAGYPLSDIANGWLELRGWATKVGRDTDSVEQTLREMRKDPEGAQILKENGIALMSDGMKLALSAVLAQTASMAEFFVNYGYDATAWETSRRRINERIRNQETNLVATCKLSEQLKKTTVEVGICHGRYPAETAVMPDPAKCR